MPQKKYTKYAITISPLKENVSLVDSFVTDYVSKKSTKYCYVKENGRNGDHKHLHMYVEFTTAKRKHELEASIKTFCHRKEPTLQTENDNILVKVCYANSPAYWIDDYMGKEVELTFIGIDREVVKKDQEERDTLMASNSKKKVYRHQFLTLYDLTVKKGFMSEYKVDSSSYFVELCAFLDTAGYEVSPLLIQPKQFRRMILYYHRDDKKIETTIYDVINSEFRREENVM